MQQIFKKKYLTPLIHVVLWSLVFFWPFLVIHEKVNLDRIIIRNWIPSSCMLVVFYMNYWLLVDKFFFKKKNFLFLMFNVLLVLSTFVLMLYVSQFFESGLPMELQKRRLNIPFYKRLNIPMFIPMTLTVGMCVGVKLNEQWSKKELLLEKVRKSQLDSEIKYLRHQIQPHFLFNTLNNIYSLVDIAPGLAKTSIHSLSKMMRYLLHDASNNRVSLSKEIEFLERFISLMKLRVSDHLNLETSFPVINQPIQIAPLLLLPFIENAFKHGINATQQSFIHIDLSIKNDEIYYVVKNSSYPENNSKTDSGVGLTNLKKRLDLMYGENYKLSVEEKNNVYLATLIINFKA